MVALTQKNNILEGQLYFDEKVIVAFVKKEDNLASFLYVTTYSRSFKLRRHRKFRNE